MAESIWLALDNSKNRVYLTPEQRARHMQITGPTGTSKSKLLLHMIRQDILADHGLCFVGSHGAYFEAISRWIADNAITRSRDVVLLDFLSSEQLADVMAGKGLNLDLNEIIENRKVLLVNLQPSIHLTDDGARFLGALLISRFLKIAPSRKDAAEPFYFYIDQCQNFFSPELDSLLEEGRKSGLHLILAHPTLPQGVSEYFEPGFNSIVRNTRIKAVFGDLPREYAASFGENHFHLDINGGKKIYCVPPSQNDLDIC